VKEQNRQEYYLRLMSDGHKLYQTGWYGPAMGRFRQAAAVRPQSQNAHLWIARSAMRTGRYEIARAAAERAIAISPNNDAAREARALLDQLKVVDRERL
jgi:tetratricopeptide (TPR) repeat protein